MVHLLKSSKALTQLVHRCHLAKFLRFFGLLTYFVLLQLQFQSVQLVEALKIDFFLLFHALAELNLLHDCPSLLIDVFRPLKRRLILLRIVSIAAKLTFSIHRLAFYIDNGSPNPRVLPYLALQLVL